MSSCLLSPGFGFAAASWLGGRGGTACLSVCSCPLHLVPRLVAFVLCLFFLISTPPPPPDLFCDPYHFLFVSERACVICVTLYLRRCWLTLPRSSSTNENELCVSQPGLVGRRVVLHSHTRSFAFAVSAALPSPAPERRTAPRGDVNGRLAGDRKSVV